MNQLAKCLGQRSFRSKVIVQTDPHTHSTECSTWTTQSDDPTWVVWSRARYADLIS